MPAQVHSVSQSLPKIVDVATLALGFGYLLRGPHDRSPAEPVRQRGAFEPAVSGKHVVRKLRGRGHNVLKCYNELLVHKSAEDELHVGEAHNRVVSETEERLDGIRCPIRHGSESGRGVCHIAAPDQISVFLAPNPLCRFSQRGGAAICKGWVGISAELLRLCSSERTSCSSSSDSLTIDGWNPCNISPPGTSRLPVRARNVAWRRMADVLLRCWSVIGDHGITAGPDVA